MSEINFGSTYRIPITQQGINKSKKIQLKSLIGAYGGLVGTGNTGFARVSMTNNKDESFLRKLRKIGYRIFQEFKGENLPNKDIDEYIKTCLDNRDYKQYGKQKAPVINKSVKLKYQDYTDDSFIGKINSQENEYKPIHFVKKHKSERAEQNRIRNSESYKDIVERYGKEAAEIIFFFFNK